MTATRTQLKKAPTPKSSGQKKPAVPSKKTANVKTTASVSTSTTSNSNPKQVTPLKHKKGKAPSPRKVKTFTPSKSKRPQAHCGIVCSTKANVLTIYFLHATKDKGAYLGDIYQKVKDSECTIFDDVISFTCARVNAEGETITQTPNVSYFWYQFVLILDPESENNASTRKKWGERVAHIFTDYAKGPGRDGVHFAYPCQYRFHQDITPNPTRCSRCLTMSDKRWPMRFCISSLVAKMARISSTIPTLC